MAKVRVHELAKELGITSKKVLEVLKESGEFVKSASSTIEAPVVRKARSYFEAHPEELAEAQKKNKKKAKKPSKAAPKSQSAVDHADVAADRTHEDAGQSAQEARASSAPEAIRDSQPAAQLNVPAASAESSENPSQSAHAAGEAPHAHTSLQAEHVNAHPGKEQAAGSADATGTAADSAPASAVSFSDTLFSDRIKSKVKAKPGDPHMKPGERGARRSGQGSPERPKKQTPRATHENSRTVQENHGVRTANTSAKPEKPAVHRQPIATPGEARRSAQAAREAAPPRPQRRGGPRPGNSPFSSHQGMGRSKGGRGSGSRPGNSPFASRQGMGTRAGGSGSHKGGSAHRGESRSGHTPQRSHNPITPATMGSQFGTSFRPADRPGRGGRNNAGGQGGYRSNQNGNGFGRGGFTRSGGKARGGSTAGAFGRQGGSRSHHKSRRTKRQEMEEIQSPVLTGVQVPRGDGHTLVRVRAGASLADFAEKIQADPAALVTVLFRMGEMATSNQSLDEDTFQLLGAELGYDIKIMSAEDEDREILESFDIDLDAEKESQNPENLERRPPVVTVMGHVDHGKTKLLDAIRHTDVVEDEAGGITQSIGAYQTTVHVEDRDRHITFIDTPGHEAFTAMRARGADVTDVAVLVVAANDGVMPQTVEAINHAKAADVPIVVAVNKIDVEGANPDKVRAQLTEYDVVAEEYGGDVPFVDISAKKRMNIGSLLEAILATSDILVEPKADPHKSARGVAIEAKLDQGRGSVITALVQDGTLHVGDPIVVGTAYGTVRALIDDRGRRLDEAGPSRPVQVLGLKSVPNAGDQLIVAEDERTARQISEKREIARRAATLAKRRKRISLEDLNAAIEEGKTENLNLIIKGESSGSVEALESSLLDIDAGSDEVQLNVIHRGVGSITQSDIDLATVDSAIIIGFNVRPAERVADMAEREGIEMKFYSVIYDAINDVEAALKGKLKPVYEEVQLGTAEVRALFKSGKAGIIAGSIVRSGTIKRGTKARLKRGDAVVAEDLEIVSLRREKDDVTSVKEGYECGITLGFKDVQVGDIIETWEMREKPRDKE